VPRLASLGRGGVAVHVGVGSAPPELYSYAGHCGGTEKGRSRTPG
jgi:hypothetical protein